MRLEKIQREIKSIKSGLNIAGQKLEKESEYFMAGYTKTKTEKENKKQGVLSYTYIEPLETIRVEQELEKQMQNIRKQTKEENESKLEAYLKYMILKQKIFTEEERTLYETIKSASMFNVGIESEEVVFYKLGEVYSSGDCVLIERYLNQEGVDPRVLEIMEEVGK